MSKQKYEIIPEKVPKMKKLQKESKYDGVLDDFFKADIDSARITMEDTKDSNLAIGLRQRITVRGLDLEVAFRTGKGIYLKKGKRK